MLAENNFMNAVKIRHVGVVIDAIHLTREGHGFSDNIKIPAA